jgi:protein-disulfide isomerase
MPVAFWGLLAFLSFALLVGNTRGQRAMGLWWVIFGFGLLCSIISLYYGYIAAHTIHSYCIFCLLCYLCYFAITFYAFIIVRRYHIPLGICGRDCKNFLYLQINRMLLAILLSSFLLLYWKIPPYWQLTYNPTATTVATGRTETGAHWIGASDPELTIEEYADYMCFQCGKMHYFLRNLVNSYPDKIRLVHHHFPIDHQYNPLVKEPFHVGAGQMALLAIYAGTQNKFWEMNDELYHIMREKHQDSLDLKDLADRVGLSQEEITQAFTNPEHLQSLAKDIEQGLQQQISSTPSYVISGKVYAGTIPTETLNKIKQ